MTFHPSTFDYLKPSPRQVYQMAKVREQFKSFAHFLDAEIPEGPDKTFLMRGLRSIAMWANVAITRLPDGTPRMEN